MKNKIIRNSIIWALISLLANKTNAQDEENKRIVINTPLDTSQGIGFEPYAPLKLIRETRTLIFVVDLAKLVDEEKSEDSAGIEKARAYCEEINHSCLKDMIEAEKTLQARIRELKDLTKRQTSNRRKKRMLGLMSIDDGEKLRNSLEEIRSFTIEMLNNLVGQYQNLSNVMVAQNLSLGAIQNLTNSHNNMTVNLTAIVMTSNIQFKMIRFEEKIKAIYRVFVNKRMDSDLITVDEFQDQLNKVNNSVESTNMTLPNWSVRDYYNNLEIRCNVTESILSVRMDIPLVEKAEYTLSKILKLPTRLNGRLVIMNTDWSYIASDSERNNVITFLNLDLCYTDAGAYLCELQSPIHKVDSKDCLTNMYRNMRLDSSLCGSIFREVSLEQLTFIKRSEGRYFYYSPNAESLSWFCDEENHDMSLNVHSSGILSIPPGCYIDAGDMKLLATGRKEEPPFEKENFISVQISLAEIDQMIQAPENSKVIHHPIIRNEEEYKRLFQNVSAHRDLVAPRAPDTPEKMGAVSLCLSIAMFAGLFVLYFMYMRKSKDQKD